MRFLRSNTAVIITVGPFYDKTDGVTIETALTITNERITLTADTDGGSAPTNILDNITGATSGTANDLNYITGNDAGMMQLELAAADTNRVGRMMLSITDAANHCPVFHEFFVLPQAIYDWLTGVIVPLPANVTTWLGTAAATPTVAGVPEVDLTHVAGATTNVAALATNVDAILTDTAVIGAAGVGLTAVALADTTSDGVIADAVWNAATATYGAAGSYGLLVETDLDATVSSRASQTSVDTVDNYIDTEITDIQNRLPAALVGGRIDASVGAVAANAITAAAIADGAIDNATFAADTGMVTIRSNTAQAGAATTITLDAAASAVTDFYKNDLIVLTGGTGAGQGRYCTAYNGTTKVATVSTWATNPDVTTTFAIIAADAIVGATAPTAVEVADEVQTRTIAAVTTVNGLAANVITAAATAADFTTEIQSGLATAAALTAVDDFLDTEVAAILAAVDTEVAAIKAKTDSLTFTAANKIDANVLAVSGDTDSVARLERVLSGNISGTVGAASTTTNIVTSAMDPAAAVTDQFKGRILTFDAATTTANLRGQSTDITASTSAGVLTVTALTTAPVSGDTFTVS